MNSNYDDAISRSALIDKLEKVWRIPHDWDGSIVQECEDAFAVIEDAPALDVVPVVHAEWHQKRLTVPKGLGQTYLVWACSACHKHEKKRSAHCPNCGAKMDGGVADG